MATPCFEGGADEQIYLMELSVQKVKLTPDLIKYIGNCPLVVKVKFLEFPIFEIAQREFSVTITKASRESIDFNGGTIGLFLMQPRNLVAAMKTKHLKTGVYCTGDNFPMAQVSIPLSGCLCDQVAQVLNETKIPPRPYTLKGTFTMLDPAKCPGGDVTLEFHLTCFGKSIMTDYTLAKDSFIFKNHLDDSEFHVTRVVPAATPEDDVEPCKIDNNNSQLEDDGKKDNASTETFAMVLEFEDE